MVILSFFSDTGKVSFIIYGFFIILTIAAMFIAFRIIKNGNLEPARLEKMIEIFKYSIVTVAIATVSLVITDLFKEREQDLKELEYFDKYADDVKIADNIQARLQLSKYFSIVAPSGEMKKSWKEYCDTVRAELDSIKKIQKRIKELEAIPQKTIKDQVDFEQLQEKINLSERPLVNPPVTVSRPTIYIQYSNKENKRPILDIQEIFKNYNWTAPGIEYREIGCDNTIRYFNDEDRNLADEANDLLKNIYTVKRSYFKAPKNQIEIWIKN